MPRTTIVPIKVQKFLKGVRYPTDRKSLIEAAKRNKADNEVISILEKLKSDKFNSPAEVSKGIGEVD